MRVLRLRESEEKVAPERGKVLAFVGAKAGMGTTTIATNTAFALSQEGRRRVLLTDFELSRLGNGTQLDVRFDETTPAI